MSELTFVRDAFLFCPSERTWIQIFGMVGGHPKKLAANSEILDKRGGGSNFSSFTRTPTSTPRSHRNPRRRHLPSPPPPSSAAGHLPPLPRSRSPPPRRPPHRRPLPHVDRASPPATPPLLGHRARRSSSPTFSSPMSDSPSAKSPRRRSSRLADPHTADVDEDVDVNEDVDAVVDNLLEYEDPDEPR